MLFVYFKSSFYSLCTKIILLKTVFKTYFKAHMTERMYAAKVTRSKTEWVERERNIKISVKNTRLHELITHENQQEMSYLTKVIQ